MLRLPPALLAGSIAAALACGCGQPAAEHPSETLRMLAGGRITREFMGELQKLLPDLHVTMEDIRGSDFVVAALQHGVADAGFAQADTVYAAYRTTPASDEMTQL